MRSFTSINLKIWGLTTIAIFCFITNTSGAQSNHIKDTFKIEKNNSFYPSISIGRSFYTKEYKAGINLIMITDITKYKKNRNPPKPCSNPQNQEWIYHNGNEIFSVFSLNHHFIKDNTHNRIYSQSIEYTIYSENHTNTFIGLGLQIKHYNFQTFSISPQIKILPPFLNLYAQRNFHQSSIFSIPKYEFGIEFNPRILYEIGKFILED